MNNIKSIEKSKYSAISLFSGCGGLDLGVKGGFQFLDTYYKKNPFNFLFANDINEKAMLTHKYNFKNECLCCDILDLLNKPMPNCDLLLGGFPCQDFSLSGKRQGLNSDRGNLYKAMVRAVNVIKPKVFIAENVKGLLIWENGKAIQTIIEAFTNCGYQMQYKLLNSADYGVPQLRERVIIVGVRDDIGIEFKYPKQTHFKDFANGEQKWVTLQEAIGDLEDENKLMAQHNWQYSKAKKNKGQGNSTTRANMPAPTMRAEHHGNIEFHYSLPRRLAAREAARIQSFPDEFKFLNSTTDAYRQIGNAVPPVLSWHITQSILKILENREQ